MRTVLLLAFASLSLAACASDAPQPPRHQMPGETPPRDAFHPPGEMMEKYDANKDGSVTLAELNAGLRAEFNAADTNHDGVLNMDEARVVNAARLSTQESAASPLIDWNEDGHIDFHEFATAARSVFEQVDRNEDGVLTPDELHPVHRAPHHGPTQQILPYGEQR